MKLLQQIHLLALSNIEIFSLYPSTFLLVPIFRWKEKLSFYFYTVSFFQLHLACKNHSLLFSLKVFGKSPESLNSIEKIRVLFAGVSSSDFITCWALTTVYHGWVRAKVFTNFLSSNKYSQKLESIQISEQIHRKIFFLFFSLLNFSCITLTFYFPFLGFSTSSSSSSLYMPLAIYFISYLIHARFLLHLWFTRSLKKDWSLCSAARQFLLLVASNLHFVVQFTARWAQNLEVNGEDNFLNSFSLWLRLSRQSSEMRSVLAQRSLNKIVKLMTSGDLRSPMQ